MDIKQIQELVKLVNKTNIGEITIEENGTKITIKQKKDPNQTIYTQAAVSAPDKPVAAIAAPPSTAPKEKAPATSGPEPKADNLITIKSPMIGTFY
ncbi:MAG TPA: acetyl-CoA carboxylase, biotin carboxyl carrier protein, partial [Ferruginibacter sp.]|nr:acetyl-CoA carboxylase, biotin carboxyl carrier protein [Ferruginibacter sp.]